VHIDLAVDHETRAFRLADRGKGPGADQCDLAPQQIVAHVEGYAVAFADEAARAPGPGRAHGACPRARRPGGVEREIGAAPMGELPDRRDCILRLRVHYLRGTELLRALETLLADVEGNDPRTHRDGKLRRREADRPLAEDRDGVAAGEIHPPQRAIGRAGTARDRRARLVGKRIWQRHERRCRYLEIIRMAAVAAAVACDETLLAQLRPAGPALPAPPA